MPDNDFSLLIIARLESIQRSVDELRDSHAQAMAEQAQLKTEWHTTKRVLGWLITTSIALISALAAYASEVAHASQNAIK